MSKLCVGAWALEWFEDFPKVEKMLTLYFLSKGYINEKFAFWFGIFQKISALHAAKEEYQQEV